MTGIGGVGGGVGPIEPEGEEPLAAPAGTDKAMADGVVPAGPSAASLTSGLASRLGLGRRHPEPPINMKYAGPFPGGWGDGPITMKYAGPFPGGWGGGGGPITMKYAGPFPGGWGGGGGPITMKYAGPFPGPGPNPPVYMKYAAPFPSA